MEITTNNKLDKRPVVIISFVENEWSTIITTIWMNLTDLVDGNEPNLRVHISYDFICKKF